MAKKLQCVTERQFNVWKSYRDLAVSAGVPSVNFCTDCTPEYAAEMRAAGKCVYPNVRFVKDSEGGTIGVVRGVVLSQP